MQPAPRISVVIPARNEAALIAGAVERLSALNPYEIIVVDGGSNDNTAGAAERAGARVLRCEPGRALQQNAGAAAAAGELLLFLHVDTVLPLAAHAELQRFAATDKHWGRFDVRLSGAGGAFRVIEWFMNKRSRLTGVATGDQAIFVRRAGFDLMGGFSAIALMEDIDLSSRLLRLSPPFCSAKKVMTSSRRWETRGIARTVLLMWRLRLLYFLGVSPDRLAALYR